MYTLRLILLAGLALVFVWHNSAVAQTSPRARIIEFWDDSLPTSGLRPNHSPWQEILDGYLITNHPSNVNRFDYAAVTDLDEQKLIDYLSYLQQLDPRQLNSARQKAYWMNLYNATLVAYLIRSNTTGSIRSLNRGDFWDLNRFTIASQQLSFNDIEHGILRPIYKDERIHFALFRGAVGWADLPAKAFLGDTVETQLDEATRAFLSHPRAVRISGDQLELSRLFKWKEDDFGSNTENVKRYIKSYLDPEQATQVDRVDRVRYQFDWSLNSPE